MYRAIAILFIMSLPASALAQGDAHVWRLQEAPQAWRIAVGGEAFPDGLQIAGQAIRSLRVYPQGVVSLNNDLIGDAVAPGPLADRSGRFIIAPFWADLADRACPAPNGYKHLPSVEWSFDGELEINWMHMPHADCEPSSGTLSATMRLGAAPDGTTTVTFAYTSVGPAGAFTPRAGLVFGRTVFELFGDETGVPDRAKALLDGGSERQRFEDLEEEPGTGVRSPPPVERGVWLIEVGADGRVVGDTDQDGIRANDNCPRVPNPAQLDNERDGTGDACDVDDDDDFIDDIDDNCPWVSNPTQDDLDRDRRGDVCDLDDDNDGWTDHFDVCPRSYNPNQLDLDRDGRGNACDPDVDGDDAGALLGHDQCPFIADPERKDSDGDSIGDACDLAPQVSCFGQACWWQLDSDGDEVADADDLCPEVADPFQKDLDLDGIGDACDADRDGDGELDGRIWLPMNFAGQPLILPSREAWSP